MAFLSVTSQQLMGQRAEQKDFPSAPECGHLYTHTHTHTHTHTPSQDEEAGGNLELGPVTLREVEIGPRNVSFPQRVKLDIFFSPFKLCRFFCLSSPGL